MWYCPICGMDSNPLRDKCLYCGTDMPVAEAKHEMKYYQDKSKEKYGHSANGDFILFDEEIKCNPYFDEEIHRQAQKKYDKANAESFGQYFNSVYRTNAPKCPTCQSTNIKKISDTKRAVHGLAFGLFSKTARSQFECNNCGYKW